MRRKCLEVDLMEKPLRRSIAQEAAGARIRETEHGVAYLRSPLSSQRGYDIIGDVHGHFSHLVNLLRLLGYREGPTSWSHPFRVVIFTGDLINRGPEPLKVLQLVRSMCRDGSAQCVLGNHELHTIAWWLPRDDGSGDTINSRAGMHSARWSAYHQAFTDQVKSSQITEWIGFFLSLPLWIEGPGFSVAHATFNDQDLRLFSSASPSRVLTPELLALAYDPDSDVGRAIRRITSGRLSEADTSADEQLSSKASSPLLVFVGHHSLPLGSALQPLTDTFACVDFGVARGGPLAAYRYSGETRLFPESFVSVDSAIY